MKKIILFIALFSLLCGCQSKNAESQKIGEGHEEFEVEIDN